MIQRVQSVYLLFVTVLLSFLIIFPYAEITLAKSQMLTFQAHAINISADNGISDIYKTTLPVLSLVIITSLLSFVCIFLYSRRIIQIRLCLLNTVLLIILLVIMFIYYIHTRNSSMNVIYSTFKFPAIFPFLGVIFNLMAYKEIRRDELLVNSFKRIR